MYKWVITVLLSLVVSGCTVTIYDGKKEAEKAKIEQLNAERKSK